MQPFGKTNDAPDEICGEVGHGRERWRGVQTSAMRCPFCANRAQGPSASQANHNANIQSTPIERAAATLTVVRADVAGAVAPA